ncbi:J domain-containing protein 1 [Leucoagaricus sp. SymC.cos]|nr:J domain-containing protein 1 [Leucoagaricus sp. SymC.cos]
MATKHHPYPFPKHPRPTPYEIFHLPTGASSAEIKSRYYDLVRYHHPDSSHARLYTPCPNERNNRFQTILSAYDFLQNPSATGATRGHFGHGSGFDPYMAEINRRRRTSQNAEYMRQRRQAMDAKEREREQEKWNRTAGGPRERVMMALGVFALLGGLYPSFFLFPFRLEKTHRDAASNLTRARNDAQEIGHMRREELRKRVRDIKAAKEVKQRSLED